MPTLIIILVLLIAAIILNIVGFKRKKVEPRVLMIVSLITLLAIILAVVYYIHLGVLPLS
ncbi:hypothetical protein [Holzapfeliella floricola]|uniref:hypothetical protein n=1 Tax=Holzapfeliella floricola TaxID=679249 RepID=UPI00070547AB|nr:hypothetical protein [Holzapfeliella floricola]